MGFSRTHGRKGSHTRQGCRVQEEEGFIAIFSAMYDFLSNQKQFGLLLLWSRRSIAIP